MRSKASKQTWLDSIYKVREKWAECYMKAVFTLGMRNTQLSESLNSDLKRHFKSDFDIIRFLKHFERVVEYKRKKELESEFESRKKKPRIKMRTPMLIQASRFITTCEKKKGQSSKRAARKMENVQRYITTQKYTRFIAKSFNCI